MTDKTKSLLLYALGVRKRTQLAIHNEIIDWWPDGPGAMLRNYPESVESRLAYWVKAGYVRETWLRPAPTAWRPAYSEAGRTYRLTQRGWRLL